MKPTFKVSLMVTLFALPLSSLAHGADVIVKYDLLSAADNKKINESAEKLSKTPDKYVGSANSSGAAGREALVSTFSHLPQGARTALIVACSKNKKETMAEQMKCQSNQLKGVEKDAENALILLADADESQGWAAFLGTDGGKPFAGGKHYLNLDIKAYCGESPTLACARNVAHTLKVSAKKTNKALGGAYFKWATWGKLKHNCEKMLKAAPAKCGGITSAEKLDVKSSELLKAGDPSLLTYVAPVKPKDNGIMTFDADEIKTSKGGGSPGTPGDSSPPPATKPPGGFSTTDKAGEPPCPDAGGKSQGSDKGGIGGSGFDTQRDLAQAIFQSTVRLMSFDAPIDVHAPTLTAYLELQNTRKEEKKPMSKDDEEKFFTAVEEMAQAMTSLQDLKIGSTREEKEKAQEEVVAILKEIEDRLVAAEEAKAKFK